MNKNITQIISILQFNMTRKNQKYFFLKKQGIRGFSQITESDLVEIIIQNSKGEKLVTQRTLYWEINITQLCKQLGKSWKVWKRYNLKVIKTWETLLGKPLLRQVGPKNRIQTYVDIVLAFRVLNDFDETFSYLVFERYTASFKENESVLLQELEDTRKSLKQKTQLAKDQLKKIKSEKKLVEQKLVLSKAEIAKLKNQTITVDLTGGSSLFYAYECNGQVKFGTSFCNKNGQRIKSHRTSVPNLTIGFIIYASKSDLQCLNRIIKARFKIRRNIEHIDRSISEVESFVFGYLKLMDIKYKKETVEKLALLEVFFKT